MRLLTLSGLFLVAWTLLLDSPAKADFPLEDKLVLADAPSYPPRGSREKVYRQGHLTITQYAWTEAVDITTDMVRMLVRVKDDNTNREYTFHPDIVQNNIPAETQFQFVGVEWTSRGTVLAPVVYYKNERGETYQLSDIRFFEKPRSAEPQPPQPIRDRTCNETI
ncbi:MAG TPA: hypothetical protein PLH57_03080 [Oligoflexia bacterium]|nr:hypothetical protein [Oligoflexia bacterium]